MEVLQVVFEQVVVGSGVCSDPGAVLVHAEATLPEFPETVEQARQREEVEERISRGEEVGAQELTFDLGTPRESSLEIEEGLTLDPVTVDAIFDRQGCSLGDLVPPPRWSVSRLEAEQHEKLFAAGIVKGWKRTRSRYPEMVCLVKFSAPGYTHEPERAVVSYARMRGPLAGMGGFVVLRRRDGTWQIERQESLWVS